mmetsp:Transcript_14050/g.46861  ORF Transcript_14050/g.46861 Transcript_14050/m.46861 type:complete len:203 (-) Transcript_14050:404-1012(-)
MPQKLLDFARASPPKGRRGLEIREREEEQGECENAADVEAQERAAPRVDSQSDGVVRLRIRLAGARFVYKGEVREAHDVAKDVAGHGGGHVARAHEDKGRVRAEKCRVSKLHCSFQQRPPRVCALVHQPPLQVVPRGRVQCTRVAPESPEGGCVDSSGPDRCATPKNSGEQKMVRPSPKSASRSSGTMHDRNTTSSVAGPMT